MSYREVMDLPIKAFWLMNESIGRVSASEDVRKIEAQISSQSNEGYELHRKHLIEEMGQVFKGTGVLYDETRDEAGFEELRAMAMA